MRENFLVLTVYQIHLQSSEEKNNKKNWTGHGHLVFYFDPAGCPTFLPKRTHSFVNLAPTHQLCL